MDNNLIEELKKLYEETSNVHLELIDGKRTVPEDIIGCMELPFVVELVNAFPSLIAEIERLEEKYARLLVQAALSIGKMSDVRYELYKRFEANKRAHPHLDESNGMNMARNVVVDIFNKEVPEPLRKKLADEYRQDHSVETDEMVCTNQKP